MPDKPPVRDERSEPVPRMRRGTYAVEPWPFKPLFTLGQRPTDRELGMHALLAQAADVREQRLGRPGAIGADQDRVAVPVLVRDLVSAASSTAIRSVAVLSGRPRCVAAPGSPQSEVGRWRGARGAGPFPSAPSRTGRASFPASRSPVMNSVVSWWAGGCPAVRRFWWRS